MALPPPHPRRHLASWPAGPVVAPCDREGLNHASAALPPIEATPEERAKALLPRRQEAETGVEPKNSCSSKKARGKTNARTQKAFLAGKIFFVLARMAVYGAFGLFLVIGAAGVFVWLGLGPTQSWAFKTAMVFGALLLIIAYRRLVIAELLAEYEKPRGMESRSDG